MGRWIDVPRAGGEDLTRAPLVTLRPKAVAFNSVFVRSADLKRHPFVSFKVDPEEFRIGIRFHGDASDPTALTLTHDGGGGGHRRRERNNLSVMAVALMSRHRWIMATATERDSSLRRFKPEWLGMEQLWVINLRPAFERHATQIEEIPGDARGIYRYIDDGEITYIGKGNIRDRARSGERERWKWDRIEYSLVPDDAVQTRWETWWLDWHEQKHGRLPTHNRIGGAR